MKEFPWEELQERLDYLKNVLREHRITPEKGYGLQYMIEETEAVLRQEKKDLRQVDLMHETIKSIKGLQSLLILTESLKTLDKRQINYHSQLMNCRTGNIDYGEREQKQKDIYYKDFELEIFIAAQLADKTDLKVILPQDQGPFDIIVESDFAIQVKHPSNIENAFDRLGKFQRDLAQSDLKGIFAVGHEDAFNYGDRIQFPDEGDFDEYFHTIAIQIDKFGMSVLARFEKLENIVGFIATTTMFVLIGLDSSAGMNLRRFSNSFVIENRVAGERYSQVTKALSVFNRKLRHITFEDRRIIVSK
jgi:uncharacterized protein (DUF1330 family)